MTYTSGGATTGTTAASIVGSNVGEIDETGSQKTSVAAAITAPPTA